jgi:magnesium-dependent phosphatase 1
MSLEAPEVGFCSDLIEYWDNLSHKPKVIVLDLDWTLWPFYTDYTKILEDDGTRATLNPDMTKVSCFKDVQVILNTLVECCFKDGEQLAVASKALNRDRALQLLDLFELKQYFSSLQIYSVSKSFHMSAIKDELSVEFEHMLFFDDNKFNVRETAKMGVCSFQVRKTTGFDFKSIKNGLRVYQRFSERINQNN